MTDAIVDVRMSAKDAEQLQAWQRQRQSLAAYQEGLEKVSKSSKSMSDEIAQGFRGVGESVMRSVMGFEAVRRVSDFVVESYREEARELKEVVAHQRESREELVHMLSMSGKLQDAKQVEAGLGEITTATKSGKLAAFKAISNAAPELPTDRKIELTKQLAPLEATRGEEGLAGVAGTAAKLQRAAPERSAFDIANIANVAATQAGDRAGELSDPGSLRALEILQHQGHMTLEKAVSFQTTAMKHNLGARDIEKLADALVDPMEEAKQSQPKNQEDAKRNEFANLDGPEERLKALLSDKETAQAVLKNKEAVRFTELGDGREWSANEAALRGGAAGKGSVAAGSEEFEKLFPLDAARHKAKIEAGKAAADRTNRTDEDVFETGQQQQAAAHAKAAPDESGLGRAFFRMTQSLDSALHYTVGGGESLEAQQLRINRDRPSDKAAPEEPPPGSSGRQRPFVDGRDGDTSIVMSPDGGAPIVNGKAAPERLVGGADGQDSKLRVIAEHAEKQTRLLEQLAAKPQEFALNVQTGGRGGPRFDATERAGKSPSAVLGANR